MVKMEQPKKIDIVSIKQRKTGFISLAEAYPAIAAEWDYESNKGLRDFYGHDISTPDKVSYSSGRKVWWLGECGHSWQAAPSERIRRGGSSCSICCNRQVLVGFNDLGSQYPTIAKEWHKTLNGNLKPTDVTYSADKFVWWQCKHGHEWKTKVSTRTRKNCGCPYCSNLYLWVGFNDLATTHPHVAKQWHSTKNGDLKPTDIIAGSHTKVWWQCECGHEWQASCGSRTVKNNPSGCPKCNKQRNFVNDFNNLLVHYPDLIAREWDFDKNTLLPHEVTRASKKKVWWKCELGHSYQAMVHNKIRSKSCVQSCPICSGRQVLVGFNDLATTNPEIALEFHPVKNGDLKPTELTKTSNKKLWWLGKCGHEWETQVFVRNRGSGCPYCAGQKVWPGFNDLATTHPKLALQLHPTKNGKFNQTNISAGSTKKKIWWLGECGHEWNSTVRSRVDGSGCPYCSNHKVLPGFNDLSSKYPDIAKEWHPTKNDDLKPTNIMYSSESKVWWLCEHGHEYFSQVCSRVSGSGCPKCNKSHGEDEIEKTLIQLNVDFRAQNTFSDRKYSQKLRDDFAILKDGKVIATIEYNGEQHYKPVDFAGRGNVWAQQNLQTIQARDMAKTKYLQDHNIPQLIIPYWDFDNIPTLIQQFISTI